MRYEIPCLFLALAAAFSLNSGPNFNDQFFEVSSRLDRQMITAEAVADPAGAAVVQQFASAKRKATKRKRRGNPIWVTGVYR